MGIFCEPECPCQKVCDVMGCAQTLEYRLSSPDPLENWNPGDQVTFQVWDDIGRVQVEQLVPNSSYVVSWTLPHTGWFVHGRKYKVAARYPSGNFWKHASGAICVVFYAHYSEKVYASFVV